MGKNTLVLDDIWNEDAEEWSNLKKLLMGGARGSKIMVTTRSRTVAKITSKCEPYVLKGLSDDDALSLFQKIAFDQRSVDSRNPTFLIIGKQILGRCVGVPLAIRSIASTLSIKEAEDEWSLFKDKWLTEVEYMEDSEPSGGGGESESFFPSLTSLTLIKCPNMKSWWSNNNDDNGTEIRASSMAFPCLFSLHIEDCPLASMPLYPSLDDELTLINTSSRPLKQSIQMNIAASTSSLPLSKLKSFHVETIEVDECPLNKSLSGWLQQLTSLRRLKISNCKELDLEGIQWETLKNLSDIPQPAGVSPPFPSTSCSVEKTSHPKLQWIQTRCFPNRFGSKAPRWRKDVRRTLVPIGIRLLTYRSFGRMGLWCKTYSGAVEYLEIL
ncbi:hypothetical protein V6N12_023211 [Hibiscus sabdariffa]|uniref:NB-ARC domain-containing protein n=1 Tax=Hibiscus sabdariffa TaxID=183260 RepID=A0ABR2FX54_9ROSI